MAENEKNELEAEDYHGPSWLFLMPGVRFFVFVLVSLSRTF